MCLLGHIFIQKGQSLEFLDSLWSPAPWTMLLNCTLHFTLHILHILSLQRPVRQELENDRKKMIRNLLYAAWLNAQQHQQPN
jgi:hypothetical protein